MNIFNKKNNIKTNKQSGFTVLESLVAILVIAISVSAAFSSVAGSLESAMYARDEVRAFYMAQEAVEAVRNRRDKNQIDQINNPSIRIDWLTGLSVSSSDPCYFVNMTDGKTCVVDTTKNPSDPFVFTSCGNSWATCNSLTTSVVKYNTSDFSQGHDSSWSSTNFRRAIQLERISDDQIAVVVMITWTKGLKTHSFKAKTLLFNQSKV